MTHDHDDRPDCLAQLPDATRTTCAALHDRLAAARRRPTACSTSPTAPSTPRSARCCSPPPTLGLVRVAFAGEDHDAVLETPRRPGQPAHPARPRAGSTRPRGELDEYFAGRRQRLRPAAGLAAVGRLPAQVLHHLPDIGYGHTASYAAVAAGRQPERGPRRRHGLRDQPAAGRGAVPPGGAQRRRDRRLPRAARRPSGSCSPWRPPPEPHPGESRWLQPDADRYAAPGVMMGMSMIGSGCAVDAGGGGWVTCRPRCWGQ